MISKEPATKVNKVDSYLKTGQVSSGVYRDLKYSVENIDLLRKTKTFLPLSIIYDANSK